MARMECYYPPHSAEIHHCHRIKNGKRFWLLGGTGLLSTLSWANAADDGRVAVNIYDHAVRFQF